MNQSEIQYASVSQSDTRADTDCIRVNLSRHIVLPCQRYTRHYNYCIYTVLVMFTYANISSSQHSTAQLLLLLLTPSSNIIQRKPTTLAYQRTDLKQNHWRKCTTVRSSRTPLVADTHTNTVPNPNPNPTTIRLDITKSQWKYPTQ